MHPADRASAADAAVSVTLWDAEEAQHQAADVFAVYDAVFGDRADFGSWRSDMFDPHCSRAGFRLSAAQAGGQLVGFGWGYLGERGQYWSDRVAATLPGDVVAEWVGGHFEVVELAVLPHARGRGTGRRLHDVLLEGVEADRAMLSTDDADTAAVRLYLSCCWRRLGELGPGVQVMGLRLPGPRGDMV